MSAKHTIQVDQEARVGCKQSNSNKNATQSLRELNSIHTYSLKSNFGRVTPHRPHAFISFEASHLLNNQIMATLYDSIAGSGTFPKTSGPSYS